MTKQLIITADDFGIDQATNEVIEELALGGKITATSLVMPAYAVKDAADRIKELPHISVGLHVTLTSDLTPIKWECQAPIDEEKPLVDKQGYFHNKYATAVEQSDSDAVLSEIAAQYYAGEQLGFNFDHLDSHDGILYGTDDKSFLSVALHFCQSHQLSFRFPRKKTSLSTALKKDHQKWLTFAEVKGIQLPDRIITHPNTRHFSSYPELKAYYMNELMQLSPGVTELCLHPSKESSDFVHNDDWQMRIWEYQLLCDGDFLRLLEEEDISLVSWKTVSQ